MGSRVCKVSLRDEPLSWVESAEGGSSDEVLATLADAVQAVRVKKSTIGWGLEELEALTREEADRSTDSDDESEDEIERMLPAPL